MKTVGELKALIKDLPDDTPIVTYKSDMEKSGYQKNVSCSVTNMKAETREAYDAFDGIRYKYEVMVESADGVPCLRIN